MASSWLLLLLIASQLIVTVRASNDNGQQPREGQLPFQRHADPDPNVKWKDFGFSLNGVNTDFMWLQKVSIDGSWSFEDSDKEEEHHDHLVPLQPLQLSPAATVLNYGQGLFEGIKAFRRVDDGTEIVLFRPEFDAMRMQQGAQRFLLPPVSTRLFVRACQAVVRANSRWVPPAGQGALYLRPLLLGTGAALGVKPSTEATFCIYASPVGNYFKGDLKPIRLQAVQGYSRAGPGGAGAIKACGNYAPAFAVQQLVRHRGYDEVLCLDALTGQAVEEAGASNFFVLFSHNRTLVTPPAVPTGTILPGITRLSLIELAKQECGFTVLEKRLTLDDLEEAARKNGEAFCCGTGAVITPVSRVSIWNDELEQETKVICFLEREEVGPWTRRLFNLLTSLQIGTAPTELAQKYRHWLTEVDP